MQKRPANRSADNLLPWLKLAGAFLALAVGGWLVYRHFAAPRYTVNSKPFASLGEFAADELSQALPGGGRIQLVYDVPDTTPVQDERFTRALEMQAVQALAFKSRLAGRGHYTFAPDVKLPRSPMAMRSGWPGGRFQSLAQVQDANLVLFSSLPPLGEVEQKLLQQRTGKLVVVGSGLPDIQPAVKAKLVHMAIANRVPVPPSTAGNESPAEWVRRVYAVLTPERSGP